MAHFERMDFQEKNRASYHIIDDYGSRIQLTPEQAYELLQQLYERRDEMWDAIHPPMDIAQGMLEFMRTPGKAWHPETKQEEPLQQPEIRDVHEDYQPQEGDVYL